MINTIKLLFYSVSNYIKLNKKTLFSSALLFILALLLVWNSGYLGQQLASERIKQIAVFASVFIIVFLYMLFIDYSQILSELRRRNIRKFFNFESIMVMLIILMVIFSIIFNRNISKNINGYLMLLFVIMFSCLIIKLFPIINFVKMFITIITTISVISLVIYLFYFIAGRDLGTAIISKSNNRLVSSFIGIFYRIQTNYNDRLQGPFWEPGVLATFSLITILLYHYFIDKKKLLLPLFFTLIIILTKSTAGYLILIPIWFIIIMNRLAKRTKTKFFLFIMFAGFLSILFYPLLLPFLSKAMPSVFNKIVDQDISFLTRVYSLVYGFRIYITSPIWGVGGVTAREMYFELIRIDGRAIDAFTSTLGFYIASFGLIGFTLYTLPIIGLIINKKIDIEDKFMLCFVYFLITQKESHVEILLLQILYLYLFFGSFTRGGKSAFRVAIYNDSDSKTNLINLLFRKDEAGNIASNLTLNTFIKILSLIIGFITIPIYYRYFGDNPLFYGLWLTIISTSTWILTFDFGFGNSLRNRLAEAIVKKDDSESQKLISTTYLLTVIMSVILLLTTTILIFTTNLNAIFKIDPSLVSLRTLRITTTIIIITISLELILKNVIYVLQVIGKSGIASSLSLISNIALLFILSLSEVPFRSKYFFVSIIYLIVILLPLLLSSVYVFRIKKYVPRVSFKKVSKEAFQKIAKMGIGFFVVQLSNLFLWALNDILITNLLGNPSLVVEYTIFYKLYSSILGLSMIIQGPIWVSVSMAFARKDKKSIVNNIKFSIFFEAILFITTLLITLLLPLVLNLWLGNQAPSAKRFDIIIMIFFSLISSSYGAIVLICNGLGELKSQLYIAGFAMIFKVPLVILLNALTGNNLTWSIVILANTILLIPYIVICPIRIKKILNRMEYLRI